MKAETRISGPWEYGEKPMQRNNKKDWEAIYEKAKSGNFEGIPGDVMLRSYNNISKIAKDHMIFSTPKEFKCIWIYGESGVGKTTLAVNLANGSYYPKNQDLWWDGYSG